MCVCVRLCVTVNNIFVFTHSPLLFTVNHLHYEKKVDVSSQKRPWKKETIHKCLWQRKKEQTTNAGGKRKMASLISQAKKKKKKSETTSKPQTVAYLQAQGGGGKKQITTV